MAKILISYRREDSAYPAGTIRDQLAARFGRPNVFMDIDSIPFGQDFRTHIERGVANCDFLIAVIGKTWLMASDATGARRLDDPSDFVRVEIEAALARDIPVIPVLVENVSAPNADQLPESIRALAYRNAIPIRPPPDTTKDIEKLAESITAQDRERSPGLGNAATKQEPTPAGASFFRNRRRLAIFGALAACVAIGAIAMSWPRKPALNPSKSNQPPTANAASSQDLVDKKWLGTPILPKSEQINIKTDDGKSVSMRDIAWPATVVRTNGESLWVQDDGGYSPQHVGGWIATSDAVKLADGRDYFSSDVRAHATAWNYWMCGICWEKAGEASIAIKNYQNALQSEPGTNIDDIQIRLGRLVAQAEMSGGLNDYVPGHRETWEKHFQAAQQIAPRRPKLFFDWGDALAKTSSFLHARAAMAQRRALAVERPLAFNTGPKNVSATAAQPELSPDGNSEAVEALEKFETAQALSPNWWRVPFARAELMLNQLDDESPRGDRVFISNFNPRLVADLLEVGKNWNNRTPNSSAPVPPPPSAVDIAESTAVRQESDPSASINRLKAEAIAAILDDFDRAISLNPNSVDAYRDRAEALRLVNRLAEAETSATTACKLCNYSDAESVRTLAQVCNDLGRFQKAADYALLAAELTADDSEQQRSLHLWAIYGIQAGGKTREQVLAASNMKSYRDELNNSVDINYLPRLPERIEPPPGFKSRSGSSPQ